MSHPLSLPSPPIPAGFLFHPRPSPIPSPTVPTKMSSTPSGRVISGIRDFLCRLELSKPNLVDRQCMAINQHVLTISWNQKAKGQGHTVTQYTAGVSMQVNMSAQLRFFVSEKGSVNKWHKFVSRDTAFSFSNKIHNRNQAWPHPPTDLSLKHLRDQKPRNVQKLSWSVTSTGKLPLLTPNQQYHH